MKIKSLLFLTILLGASTLFSQNNVLKSAFENRLQKDEITRSHVTPVKIIWQSDTEGKQVTNSEVLLTRFDGQLSTSGAGMCMLRSDDD
ncbi:MAG: hypothetical protein VB054_13030, partial [Petrimonas sp.]|nr:hypothetical protein [Petrimonas sp.]